MPNQREQELMDLICARMLSKPGTDEPSVLTRVLRYVCEHSDPFDEEALSSRMIAREVYVQPRQGQSPEATARLVEDIVGGSRLRVDFSMLRQRLHEFVNIVEGRRQFLKLEIPEKQRHAIFSEEAIWVKQFWQPHFGPVKMTEQVGAESPGQKEGAVVDSVATTGIVYSEPRFYRSRSKHLFVRFLNVNERTSSERALRLAPMIAEDRLHSCRHYVSAGEITAILRLTKMLEWYGVTTQHEVSHKIEDWTALEGKHLILIGNSRTHWAIRDLQSDRRLDFKIFKDRIKNLNPQSGEPRYYKDFAWIPGRHKRQKIYVLVTRLQNPKTGQSVLLLCSNHGRAHEKVGELLTTDEALQELAARMGLEQWQPFPTEFQILLSVEIDEEEQAVSPAEYVTHRPLSTQVGGTRKPKTKS